jgi:pseudouridine kinase
MSRDHPSITVVGGANMDIVGIPDASFVFRDSNPGAVRTSAGGVGRNVAETLALLGARVRFVTAFGDDEESDRLIALCEDAGMDCTYSVRAEGVPGSRYLAVMDSEGDLAAAVNDMRALAALTPDRLDAAAFAGADAVVIDTNLQPSTIARVAELAGSAPLVLDPVSTVKAAAARPVLGRLAAIKANLREAEALSGAAGAEGAALGLVAAGVPRVFVTSGRDGVWCASADGASHLPAVPVQVRNATGAGDAFAAGVAWGVATGASLLATARRALVLSAIALESASTVSPSLTPRMIDERMEGSGQ